MGRLCCFVFEAQFSSPSVCTTDRQAGVCEGHAKGGQTPSFVSLVTQPLETLVHKVGAQWTGLQQSRTHLGAARIQGPLIVRRIPEETEMNICASFFMY